MILFFFGSNNYLISRKLRELKERYRQKSGGDLNLATIDGENLDFNEFARQTQAMPLLASSRLIVINDIFKNRSRETLDCIKDFLPKIPESTVVIFVEQSMPDKRLGLFKALNKPKVAQEFKPLDVMSTKDFIREEIESLGGQIEPAAIDVLCDFVQDDLWRLGNEISKLISYCQSEKIKRTDVENLVSRDVFGNSFKLADAIMKKDCKNALGHLGALIEAGEPPLKIFGLIVYQFRVMSYVLQASAVSNNKFAIAKQTGLNPFQIDKILPFSKKTDFGQLSLIFSRLSSIDEAIKSGKIEPGEALKDFILDTDGNRNL